jgi:glutamate carboxypeptidase
MSGALIAALQSLRDRSGEHEALLRDLVEENSFTENKAGGDLVADRIRAMLALPGLSCTAHPSGRFAAHLVFESAATSLGGHVLCIGHHDTVFPPGTFQGYRREGPLARGPGVLDMKGGIVCVAAALRALSDAGVLTHVPVRFITVGDEEVGSPESQPLTRAAARGARAALGFESGRLSDRIVTARKGAASARVIAHGRAAHAGNAHEKGANAIWALARFIDRVQGLTEYARGLTVNVGTVAGGHSKNTVPELAEALIDLRFVDIEGARALESAVAAVAAETLVPGTRIEISPSSWRAPLVRTDASADLARRYGECQREAGLANGECPLQGGGSDAATAALEGVPAIDGLGPRGEGYHTREERIELATLIQKAEALVRFLLREHES